MFIITFVALCIAFLARKSESNDSYISHNSTYMDEIEPDSGINFIGQQQQYDVTDSVNTAWKILNQQQVWSVENRLAITIAFSYPLIMPLNEFNSRRLHYLHCSLHKLYENFGKITPIDVYLWVSSDEYSVLPSWLLEEFPKLLIMPIPAASWRLPASLGPHSSWKHSNQFKEDYFIHSRWRMTFAMDFVRALGYPYILLTDDDTFALSYIPFNIVEVFNSKNITFGIREKYIEEALPYVKGLAEFTSYWMVTRDYTTPAGSLFEHVTPHNITGVTSTGWDRKLFNGCFTIISVNFWFRPLVQDYVREVLRSGGDVQERWTEQAVHNMVRLLFAPPQQVFTFESNRYFVVHGKPKVVMLGTLGCANTVSRLLAPYAQGQALEATQRVEADEEEQEQEEADYAIQTVFYISGVGPLEIADFDWHCRDHEQQIGVPCSVNPYASLPAYIDAFCRKLSIFEADCEAIRNKLRSSLPPQAFVLPPSSPV